MKAAVVVPDTLSGKPLKVVTTDFNGEGYKAYKPLRGKTYTDETPTIEFLKDIITALGGTYIESNN